MGAAPCADQMLDVMIDDMTGRCMKNRDIRYDLFRQQTRREVAEARMGHRLSARSDDDTSEFRRFHGFMLVADRDYVLALYPYPYP